MMKTQEFERIYTECWQRIQSGEETLEAALARYPEQAEALRPRLEAVQWLQQGRAGVEPRPGFVTASRRRLVNRVQAEPQTRLSLWEWLRGPALSRAALARLAAVALALALVVVPTSGVLAMVDGALPGDMLYTLKLVREQRQLRAAETPAAAAELYVAYTNRRALELQTLVVKGRYDQLQSAAQRYDDAFDQTVQLLEQVSKLDPVQAGALRAKLDSMLATQMVVLRYLARGVPPTAQPALAQVVPISQ
jgi:hypothetical protein